MANIGRTKGRRLSLALNRFAAMLVEEVRDISGKTYAELDEALGYKEGELKRYSVYPRTSKTRSPKARDIQMLEDRVAKLLKRPSHKIVIEDNSLITKKNGFDPSALVIGVPDENLDIRHIKVGYLQLGYEGDWPNYRRLKYCSPLVGQSLIDLYTWQWGILWTQEMREFYGVPDNIPIEEFLEGMVHSYLIDRQFIMQQKKLVAGILPEMSGDTQ